MELMHDRAMLWGSVVTNGLWNIDLLLFMLISCPCKVGLVEGH